MFSPKALLFDFGGTLDANGLTWLERSRAAHARAGMPAEGPAFDRAFYDADDHLAERHRLEGLDLGSVIGLQVRDTVQNLGADASKATTIAEDFTRDSRVRLAESRRLLSRWKRKYRLGLVTNFFGNMRSMLAAEGWSGLFDVVADSAEIGAAKPDSRIFEAALKPLGVLPNEAVFIGDSIPRDMRGAEALGMPHAWLAGSRTDAPCCGQAVVLRTLGELELHLQEN